MWRLRILTGEARGHEIAFEPGADFKLGRADREVEAVLEASGISRVHARLVGNVDHVAVTDLQSENGTFLNGDRGTFHRVLEGDRLYFGHVATRLERGEPAEGALRIGPPEPRPRLRFDCVLRPFAGELRDVPLADLLRLFATAKKNTTLLLMPEAWPERILLFEIVFKDGAIVGVRSDHVPVIDARSALQKALGWQEGTFDIGPLSGSSLSEPIEVEALLAE